MQKIEKEVSRFFLCGVCLISFALLASEIILTRILSVIFWYHFAFLVVSVALFGMTVGALIVYLFPKAFSFQYTQRSIAICAYLSSFTFPIGLLSLFYLPAIFAFLDIPNLLMPMLYFLLSLPFVTIGVCLCLSLTRFSKYIGKIYGVNLIGSALGCIGIIPIFNNFNAPSTILIVGTISSLSALLFAIDAKSSRLFKLLCILNMILCLSFSFKNQNSNSIRPLWVKGAIRRSPPLLDKWNFFSYITIGMPSRRPFGWGFSNKVDSMEINTKELMLLIDEGAGTVLTRFDNLSDLEYLKLDVSAIAYYLRNNKKVLVLGSGGGRDLLTALLFGVEDITGVEINRDINDICFNKLRDFTGSINNYNQIKIVSDEGRSFVSRTKEKYDIIQASLVDSWAASANGAFALTENSIYTREAWVIFLEHLTEKGILTFSRWHNKNNPAEIYRLVALAKESLQKIGIENPIENIALVRCAWSNSNNGVGTILVSRTPFLKSELLNLEKICNDLGFELVLSSFHSSDDNFTLILQNINPSSIYTRFSSNISPPRDNKPFFFYFASFEDLFTRKPTNQGAAVLRQLFLMILVFGIIFIIIPLISRPRSKGLSKISTNMIIYFASIGVGFMLIEIPLIQRLGMFLGQPIYGLTVVLFSLLFACGIGSYFTKYLKDKLNKYSPFIVLILILIILSIAYFLPLTIKTLTPAFMSMKILLSIAILVLLGIFMGMPFPVGMKIAGEDQRSPAVLYWGVNGFTSVCGSVLAVIILIYSGFQISLLIGSLCYLIAFLSLLFFRSSCHLRLMANKKS